VRTTNRYPVTFIRIQINEREISGKAGKFSQSCERKSVRAMIYGASFLIDTQYSPSPSAFVNRAASRNGALSDSDT